LPSSVPGFYLICKYFFPVVVLLLVLADYLFLFVFFKAPLAKRKAADRLSNGEVNDISIELTNRMPFVIDLKIVDELPEQMQEREFLIKKRLQPNEKSILGYQITPQQRGVYNFGDILLFAQSQLGLGTQKAGDTCCRKGKGISFLCKSRQIPDHVAGHQLRAGQQKNAQDRPQHGV
jgi:hypothetical protein